MRWPSRLRPADRGRPGPTARRQAAGHGQHQLHLYRSAASLQPGGQAQVGECKWVPNTSADYDAQAPGGSASSSVRNMAAWLTMLLAAGKPIIDHEQLRRIRLPAIVKPALPKIGSAPAFYSLGWNVNYEPTGELRVSHSGAFGQGAATAVTLYPSGLAIAGSRTPVLLLFPRRSLPSSSTSSATGSRPRRTGRS